jgi:hypothetical protein
VGVVGLGAADVRGLGFKIRGLWFRIRGLGFKMVGERGCSGGGVGGETGSGADLTVSTVVQFLRVEH